MDSSHKTTATGGLNCLKLVFLMVVFGNVVRDNRLKKISVACGITLYNKNIDQFVATSIVLVQVTKMKKYGNVAREQRRSHYSKR